ncbi:DNA primase noncatalytic subunit PriX [Candidatus Nitrosocosmicus sp. SS]|jgi:hypothetical protein|uniref:DNA primase noncatalytic subunit PriX n=1 Tax=Candidatus Nitrosocosmicus agrestis TaxID=2563600 RepID=UPI00122E8647|nr:DNA primase noncatalytic subunit PriX [Candidatus Nitrosocosmicus sp. SS]KAA2280247.1 DNA primase noncatalytic subunit PriX [Candidatus Nitrosocosmicus sp. SS]KAF0869496.1 DNA primase noncatalytic subunit PriX [Candidatus Nitrosocosmicus sp. SS]
MGDDAEHTKEHYFYLQKMKDNIDFMLSHFKSQHELFPRTILLGDKKRWKVMDFDVNERNCSDRIFAYFRIYKFVDCRINAFPYRVKHSIDFDVKNMTSTSLIMIDLDMEYFDSREYLDKRLTKILNKLSQKFKGMANPTVLWTGNGYHIYQPLNGIVFEEEQIFHNFLPYLNQKDLTTEFMRFAEKFFSDEKADPQHHPSINNCLLRVPGTINSKNGKAVEIIQKWDGKLPNVKWVAEDFFDYLVDKRSLIIKEKKRRNAQKKSITYDSLSHSSNKSIDWIENLLQVPIEDNRKICLWKIICPYLVNVKQYAEDDAFQIAENWLKICDRKKQLQIHFNYHAYLRNVLRKVSSFYPLSIRKVREELPDLYKMLQIKQIA